MYTVMVTGGIGSGKSAAVAFMKSRGAAVVSLDDVSHALLEDDEDLKDEIVDSFGDSILDADGMIVRSHLAEKVFSSREAVAELNAITFPYITAKLSDILVDSCCLPCNGPEVRVVEVPLLPEVPQMAELADEVIVVTASRELRKERLVERGLLPRDIERRMAVQPTDADYESTADCMIDNEGTRDELIAILDGWWAEHVASGWSHAAD